MTARILCLLGLMTLFGATAAAAMPSLYVDAAPNVYGSPSWAPWWSATKTDVIANTFTNLRSASLPGTHYITPVDEIVYSTMDLGRRLHWIYWLPGETTAALNNRFQVKWVIDWEGENWTYDWSTNDWALDAPNAGWVQPGSWENASGGVIGSFGFAWWATDDDAAPFNTNASAYDETNMADVAALSGLVRQNQTFARGYVRMRDDVSSDWVTSELQVDMVPEPTSLMLMAAGGFTALAGLRRRRGR